MKYASKIRNSTPELNKQKFKEVVLYILNMPLYKDGIDAETLPHILYLIDFDFYEKHEEHLTGATYKKAKS